MEIERTPGAALLCRLAPAEHFLHVTTDAPYLGGLNGDRRHFTEHATKVVEVHVQGRAFDLRGVDMVTGDSVELPALTDLGTLPPYHREKVHRLQAWLRAGGQGPAKAEHRSAS